MGNNIKKKTLRILAIFIIVILHAGCTEAEMPSDEQLENEFKSKKKLYEGFVQEYLDKGLYRIEIFSEDKLLYLPKTINPASLEKLKRQLEEQLELKLVSSFGLQENYKKTNEVYFVNYRRGLVFAGESKGLAYVIDETNIELVDDLDKINRKEISGKRLHKYIEPHWYIYFQYDE